MKVDLPGVVAEVTAAFEAYESALAAGDVEALTAAFWAAPQVVRFGLADEQRGAAELAAWRAANPSVPPGRRLADTVVTAFGADLAVVSTAFGYPGSSYEGGGARGRQSQTWVRLPEGWRIVHAHVSSAGAPAPWG